MEKNYNAMMKISFVYPKLNTTSVEINVPIKRGVHIGIMYHMQLAAEQGKPYIVTLP